MPHPVRVRPAEPAELPTLLALPDDRPTAETRPAERNDGTAAYLSDLLAKECTRPGWCFLAGQDGAPPRGSAVLWTLPGKSVPESVVLVEAPWDDADDGRSVALPLLEHACAEARALGAAELLYVIDSPVQPPQYQYHPAARERVFTDAGFALVRDGRRFRWLAGQEMPPEDPRLTFRGLPELGEEPFIALLTRLLADTADTWLAADVAERGLRGAAETLFADCGEMEHDPAWFEIGFTGDGDPAAVSLPAVNPTVAVLGFIGVDPAHRGQGFSAAVVARGTRILAEHGAREIRGDCDAGNAAMVRGFERGGYVNFAARRELIRKL
ncbi:GNAT family N-acetyltransferase [Streptomyces sp. MAR4 CNX-425]|uniref:GNAT family N-acetyltransferase n=1 Tax=Streptomyces sp. MAR4 CNX-425 TaxID=3406343 RepID=UPI003B512E67